MLFRTPALVLYKRFQALNVRRRSTPKGLAQFAAAFDLSGVAAIEFALVFPLFLLIVLAIIGYGTYIGATHSVAQLAADAARASVAGLSDTERASIAKSVVAGNASSYPLLVASKITVVAAPLPADPTEFRVSVSYDASSLPILSFGKFLPAPSKTITRSAIVKRGGY
jgi:Flp pilus assembly protein TadG